MLYIKHIYLLYNYCKASPLSTNCYCLSGCDSQRGLN